MTGKFKASLILLAMYLGTLGSSCLAQCPMSGKIMPAPAPTTPSCVPMPTPTTTTQMPMTPYPAKTLGEQTVGDYKATLVVGPAAGWYDWQNGQLVWMPPMTGTNKHIEVVLKDATGQRIIPDSKVTMTILDKNNTAIATTNNIFLWDPMSYHYGANITLPADATYTVRVNIAPPAFARHVKGVGNMKYSMPVTVTFTNVRLTPEGQFSE